MLPVDVHRLKNLREANKKPFAAKYCVFLFTNHVIPVSVHINPFGDLLIPNGVFILFRTVFTDALSNRPLFATDISAIYFTVPITNSLSLRLRILTIEHYVTERHEDLHPAMTQIIHVLMAIKPAELLTLIDRNLRTVVLYSFIILNRTLQHLEDCNHTPLRSFLSFY